LLVLSVRCRHFDNKQNEIKIKKENLQPSKRQTKQSYLIQLKIGNNQFRFCLLTNLQFSMYKRLFEVNNIEMNKNIGKINIKIHSIQH